MDYNIIFSDLDKVKKILTKLFKSELNSNIKKIFEKMEDNMFKNVVETQYLYLYSKLLNILKYNKSIKIITLEDNLTKFKSKNINEKIDFLNTLGYYDLLLILLNITKKSLDEIITFINKKNKISIKNNDINLDDLTFSSFDIFADTISNKILSKLEPNINIQFNQGTLSELNSNQQKLEQKKLEQQKLEQEKLEQQKLEQQKLEQEKLEQEKLEQEKLEQEKLEQEKLEQEKLEQEKLEQEKLEQEKLEQEKLEQEKAVEEIEEIEEIEENEENEEDEEGEEDISDTEQQYNLNQNDNNIKKNMNRKYNNTLNEYEKEELDENNERVKTNKVLNNNDLSLIELLDS